MHPKGIVKIMRDACNLMNLEMKNGVYSGLSLFKSGCGKYIGLEFSNKDVFVNLVGGLKIDDPAADLAILLAIASSMMDKAIDKETVLLGEVGLAGEIRSINKLEQRLIESSALGFKKAYIPRVKITSNLNDIPIKFKSVKLVKDIFAQIF